MWWAVRVCAGSEPNTLPFSTCCAYDFGKGLATFFAPLTAKYSAAHKIPANIQAMNTRAFYFWYYFFSKPLAEKG